MRTIDLDAYNVPANQPTRDPNGKFYIGGKLNHICSKYKVNAIRNSFSTSEFYRHHSPATIREGIEMIDAHAEKACSKMACKSRPKRTVKEMAQALFEATEMEYDIFNNPFTFERCYDFICGLFISASIRGHEMEYRAVVRLRAELSYINLSADIVPSYYDAKYGIDVIIHVGQFDFVSQVKAAIQVKPESYKSITVDGVKDMNKRKNQSCHWPVYYLYYDNDGRFINIKQVLKDFKNGL